MEPQSYCPAAREALDIWRLMGCEMRLEALPVIFAFREPDLITLLPLLQAIADVINEPKR